MQGYILSTDSDRSLILGDDGVRYPFVSLDWQNDDTQPEFGMRVDFEVRGSDAVEIYPIPVAAPVPPDEQSSASSTSPGAAPANLPIAKRIKALLHRAHSELNTHYSPIRELIGNYGVIGVGIALLAVGAFMLFDFLLNLMGVVGMIAGVAIGAVGVFMLGKEKGWWYEGGESHGEVEYAAPSPATPSEPPAEIERAVRRTSQSGDTRSAGAGVTSRRMKNCPWCSRAILYEAIRCRYCRSDIPSGVDSP